MFGHYKQDFIIFENMLFVKIVRMGVSTRDIFNMGKIYIFGFFIAKEIIMRIQIQEPYHKWPKLERQNRFIQN